MKKNEKICEVVILPCDVSKRWNSTEGLIVKCIKSWTPIGESPKETNKLSISKNWSKGVLDYYEAQHLYITSDDEIKEGDWAISTPSGKIYQVGNAEYANKDKDKKIIASTDEYLRLPQPSKMFIDEFISEYNKGNIIKYVLVELVEVFPTGELTIWISPTDNTITIKNIKESWSREELFDLISKYDFDNGCNKEYRMRSMIDDLFGEIGYVVHEDCVFKNL